jgi:hypothetical protein
LPFCFDRRAAQLVALACAMAIPAARVTAQAGAATDVLAGRVFDEGTKAPIDHATVSATSLANGRSRDAETGADGRYVIVFAEGGGRYVIRVRRVGYTMTTMAVARGTTTDRITVDVPMRSTTTTLAPVVVSARADSSAAVGTGSTVTSDRVIRLPLDNASDLAAIAALTPGVVVTAGTDTTTASFSVGGQRPTQNHITLDGLTFASGVAPRDAIRITTVVTSTYDVAKGQFSGGEIESSTKSGTSVRLTSLAFDYQPSALQVGAAPSAAFSRQYSLNRLSGSIGGPLVRNSLFGFVAAEASRKVNPIATLVESDPLTDYRLGISPDTVRRFLSTIEGLGLPLAPDEIPDQQTLDRGSILGRLDYVLNPANHLTVRADGADAHTVGSRGSPRGFLLNLGQARRLNGGLFAGLTTQSGSLMNDVRATTQWASRHEEGYANIPRGRVFISSLTADGAVSTYDASVGGNQDFPARSRSALYEAGDELAWLSENGAHRLKLGVLANYGTGSNDVNEEKNGLFFFNSLADLANGTAASYTRILSASLRSSSRSGFALYSGDAWQPAGGFELDYGLRLEGTAYGDAPSENVAAMRAFGLHTSHYPSELHLSPRIGFSYSAGGDKEDARGLKLRGGIGEFRGVIPDAIFANAAQSTGLPSGQTRLTCTGSSTPRPDWRAYLANPATIPTSCIGPSASTSDQLPNVILFSNSTRAPRTWRASLGLTHALVGPVAASIDLFYIRGVSQLGIPDINLRETPFFTLSNEDNRPVFVPTSRIDPATGTVSMNDSRLNSQFGQVSEVRSFLQSRTRQAIFALNGELANGFAIDASYTYTNVRDQSLGFEGEGPDDNTFGSPNIPVWGRADEERRHLFQASLTIPVRKNIELAIIGNLVSGIPFSARLATDINGDGQRNDRSFVFDPAAVNDTSIANGMRQLFATGPRTARDCLPRQFGRAAERNGCDAPWVPGFDLKLSATPRVSFAQRLTISVSALNALVGLDELLHGASNIHGWGQDASIDQRLLFVTGFVPATKTFKYRVNQHFGAASGALNPFRTPFVLSIQARMTLGGRRPNQAASSSDSPPGAS